MPALPTKHRGRCGGGRSPAVRATQKRPTSTWPIRRAAPRAPVPAPARGSPESRRTRVPRAREDRLCGRRPADVEPRRGGQGTTWRARQRTWPVAQGGGPWRTRTPRAPLPGHLRHQPEIDWATPCRKESAGSWRNAEPRQGRVGDRPRAAHRPGRDQDGGDARQRVPLPRPQPVLYLQPTPLTSRNFAADADRTPDSALQAAGLLQTCASHEARIRYSCSGKGPEKVMGLRGSDGGR
ncbi:hypothetical protein EDD90_4592 [Streptomyces sp. Ag109_O5-1]|nr:hypothetical protein EDD90_4592 [Streptomyces sp. Ag109_O5-1]